LGLRRYDRSRVDGCWLDAPAIADVTGRLLAMSYEERVSNPCIGRDRADLVLAGCAILEEIRDAFPSPRIRVADRGLREGILTLLMKEDGTYGVAP
jgi:exopolyphosphatase / guanosine-5'-triphosphate,3'-diphosphate pyrophosphatase